MDKEKIIRDAIIDYLSGMRLEIRCVMGARQFEPYILERGLAEAIATRLKDSGSHVPAEEVQNILKRLQREMICGEIEDES